MATYDIDIIQTRPIIPLLLFDNFRFPCYWCTLNEIKSVTWMELRLVAPLLSKLQEITCALFRSIIRKRIAEETDYPDECDITVFPRRVYLVHFTVCWHVSVCFPVQILSKYWRHFQQRLRLTAVLSSQFLKLGNEKMTTVQNNSYGWTLLLLPPQRFRPEGEIPRRHSSNSCAY